MRYKSDHKQETRRRIVETASAEFRANGFEAVGIVKLMTATKLTHGGFYAHFSDKEDLVAEAVVHAMDDNSDVMKMALERGGMAAMLNHYLSAGHRDHPELGCPLTSLAAEIARRPGASRTAFTQKLSANLDQLADQLTGATHDERHEKVLVMFASMVGAMTLARAINNPVLSDEMIKSTRDHLLDYIDKDSK